MADTNRPDSKSDTTRPEAKAVEPLHPTLEERARRLEREILNAFTVQRRTSLADGAGAPGSTAAGDNRAGMPDADAERGKRD